MVITLADLITHKQVSILFIGAIDETFIAASEDIAVTVGKTFVRTNLTTVDIHVGLSEDKALRLQVERSNEILIHINGSIASEIVITTTTAIDVAQHVAIEHLHVGLTGLVDTGALVH